jgi:hypothetical protein
MPTPGQGMRDESLVPSVMSICIYIVKLERSSVPMRRGLLHSVRTRGSPQSGVDADTDSSARTLGALPASSHWVQRSHEISTRQTSPDIREPAGGHARQVNSHATKWISPACRVRGLSVKGQSRCFRVSVTLPSRKRHAPLSVVGIWAQATIKRDENVRASIYIYTMRSQAKREYRSAPG